MGKLYVGLPDMALLSNNTISPLEGIMGRMYVFGCIPVCCENGDGNNREWV